MSLAPACVVRAPDAGRLELTRPQPAEEKTDGGWQSPATAVPPSRLPDRRRLRLRPDPGRLLPDAGPRRAEELQADRRQGRLGHPYLPARRDRPSGDVRPQAVRAHRVP